MSDLKGLYQELSDAMRKGDGSKVSDIRSQIKELERKLGM
jgi:hypothetical protein